METQLDSVAGAALGKELLALVADLYPICRSITGDGVRETLRRIGERVPLEVHEVPTGTQAFDWTVPREWNIRDAYVKDARGRRVVDFQASQPPRRRATARRSTHGCRWQELKPHMPTIPEHPDWVPYRTSYYHDSWGFCLSHNALLALEDGEYEVCIDSSARGRSPDLRRVLPPGRERGRGALSTHVCHPSLANDNLSGSRWRRPSPGRSPTLPRRLSYRFLFVPGTIGSITWLARTRTASPASSTGSSSPASVTPERSRTSEAAAATPRSTGPSSTCSATRATTTRCVDFSPYGYDERQYCSPGFDLPVGCFMRTPWGRYPEYHTSADDLEFVRPRRSPTRWRRCLPRCASWRTTRRT